MVSSFSIDNKSDDKKALQDTNCAMDYVQIEGSTTGCVPAGTPGTFTSKYCGPTFNPLNEATENVVVCGTK